MHKLKIIEVSYITHNVKRFVFEKPKDFPLYTPGQSVSVSIDKPGWEKEIRPFTFTSLNDWDFLEFIIKIYDDREGVTHEIGKMKVGDEFIIHKIFDSIEYKGPGIFIAGGTGITPFIPIFRALYLSKNLNNIALLYSNKTRDDIILGEELFNMLGSAFMNVFTREGVIGFRERKIDRKFLIENIGTFNHRFYVCGPKSFTKDITEALVSLGAEPNSVIIY